MRGPGTAAWDGGGGHFGGFDGGGSTRRLAGVTWRLLIVPVERVFAARDLAVDGGALVAHGAVNDRPRAG